MKQSINEQSKRIYTNNQVVDEYISLYLII